MSTERCNTRCNRLSTGSWQFYYVIYIYIYIIKKIQAIANMAITLAIRFLPHLGYCLIMTVSPEVGSPPTVDFLPSCRQVYRLDVETHGPTVFISVLQITGFVPRHVGADVIKPYSVLKFHVQASVSHRAHTQRKSPNFLSSVSYSDLSTKRPNPEYAQDRAQRRTQTNKDGSSRRTYYRLVDFVVKVRRF